MTTVCEYFTRKCGDSSSSTYPEGFEEDLLNALTEVWGRFSFNLLGPLK